MSANKNTSVDVLAVMDRLGKEWRDESVIVGRLDSADAIDSVFAAVAELIEADEAYDLARQAWLSSTSQHDFYVAARIAWKRRATALSRVRGTE